MGEEGGWREQGGGTRRDRSTLTSGAPAVGEVKVAEKIDVLVPAYPDQTGMLYPPVSQSDRHGHDPDYPAEHGGRPESLSPWAAGGGVEPRHLPRTYMANADGDGL